MEDTLYDIIPMQRFTGLESGYVLDETTICKFRHWLEQHARTKQLLTIRRRHLEKHGVMVREGAMVDATIIEAPSATKHKAKHSEMKPTRKGNKWCFGMQAHIGMNTNGYAHTVEVTAANVANVTMRESWLHGDEKEMYGNKGYVCTTRKQQAKARGALWQVLRTATTQRKLHDVDPSCNQKSSRTRARVEHPFGVGKHLWGHRKTRYRGLKKNASQPWERCIGTSGISMPGIIYG